MLKYPDAPVISLGIGDTTEPIPDVITSGMSKVFFCQLSFIETSFARFLPKSFSNTTFSVVPIFF